MAIPDFQTIMLPLLELAGEGETLHLRKAVDILAERFSLTDHEKRELVPSGQQSKFHNRVSWARTYLKKAGLLETPRRGFFCINDRGRRILAEKPSRINAKSLEQFDEFQTFKQTSRLPAPEVGGNEVSEIPADTPEETLQDAYLELRKNLADDLLETVKKSSPEFFERLVVDLLVRMGYGGSRKEAGQAIGGSGDEGIDGIIKEDRLGLDIIYVQAKRWEGVVSRPEVQKFAGALQGQRARKGVFISTSEFSREAENYAANIETKIILIDGSQLAELMMDHGVGVATEATFELKRIDLDYFSED